MRASARAMHSTSQIMEAALKMVTQNRVTTPASIPPETKAMGIPRMPAPKIKLIVKAEAVNRDFKLGFFSSSLLKLLCCSKGAIRSEPSMVKSGWLMAWITESPQAARLFWDRALPTLLL
ncbi:unnamed protein product [Heterosigma akashiwo]